MYKHIPNFITGGRIILTPPLFILAFFAPTSPTIHLVMVLSAIGLAFSDTFDGTLARALDCTSPLGKKLDPIADKITVMLFWPLWWLGMIPIIVVIIIHARDALSVILRWRIKGVASPLKSGKRKTMINMFFMCVLFAAIPVKGSYLPLLAEWRGILYWASAISISGICIWSGIDYYRNLRPDPTE